jgi:hypothetical protein
MVVNVISRAANIGYRALKVSPSLVFGDGARVFAKGASIGLKSSSKTSLGRVLYDGLKGGGTRLEKAIATKPSFAAQIQKTIKTLPSAVKNGWNTGKALALAESKSGLWGAIKGASKGISKAIPGLGNIIFAAFSIPTICGAFKDEGIGSGILETIKEGSKLAGGAIGAAIGTAFGPLGSCIGFAVGNWLTGLVTGKTHSEKVAEAEENASKLAQTEQYNNPYKYYNTYDGAGANLNNIG